MIIHKEPKEELLSTIVEVQKPKSIEGFQKVDDFYCFNNGFRR